MKKLKLFLTLLLIAVGVNTSWAQTYTHLGERITDLSQIQDGQKYMFFQCLGASQNGTFYKWIKAGASNITLERRNMPLELQGVSMPTSTYADMVWTVAKVGSNYTFYNDNQRKYASENKAMSTTAYQFTIQDYATSGSAKGGANDAAPNPPFYFADKHDTRNYNTCQAGEGFWIIGSASLAANSEQKWWNGASGETFGCWSTAHPYAIFPVVESEGTPMYDIIDAAHTLNARSDVRTTAVKLTVNGTTTTFNNLQTAANWPVYWNLTDKEFTCYAGDEITPGVDGSYSGGSMQAYVYLDDDKDGFHEDEDAVDNPNRTVVAGHDLKTLAAYRYGEAANDANWWNSKGTQSNKGNKVMPAFTAPETPGKYRMRYTIAWNSINPLGYSGIASDGGIIVDVTLNVKPSPMVNITGFDQFDDYKYYALQTNLSGSNTNPRGYLCYKSDDADYLNARQPSAFTETAQNDVNQQFRILCKDAAAHTYYLYCVANGKYAKKVADSESGYFKLQFVDTPDDACLMTLQYLGKKADYPWVVKFGTDYLNIETVGSTHGNIVNWWGGNDDRWDDGNQIKILEVGTLSDLTMKTLVEDAEYALSKVGVGYPADDADVRTELQAAYDAFTALPAPSRDAALQATLETKLANMFACRDIVLPRDGKVYTFQIRDFTGRLLNVYENGDGSNRLDVLAATEVQPADQRRAQYMCHVIKGEGTDPDKYVFINYYGDYMEWCGVSDNYPGFGDIYNPEWNDVELLNLYPGLTTNVTGTEKLLYGCFGFKFAKRHDHATDATSSDGRAGVAVFKTQGGADEWNGADVPFFTENYTSAALFNELSVEESDFENRIEFKNIPGDKYYYATFYGRYPVVNPNDAIPYYVTGTRTEDGSTYLTLEQVKHATVITREFPVIFISENNNNLYTDEEIDYLHVGLLTASAKTAIEENLATYGANVLKGTYEANQPLPDGKDIYVLNGNTTDGVGFFKYTGAVLPKNKAYYEKDASATVRGFKFDINGVETTIELNPELAEDAVIYDLSGRRVKSAANGLFIINGKKVIK